MHNIWDQAFCGVEMLEFIEGGLSVEAISSGNVAVERATKARAVNLVSHTCP